MYYAHVSENGEKQLLMEHLTGCGELSRQNALPKLAQSAFVVGMLHDIGKYQDSFQEKLNGKNIAVEHSGCGAIEAVNILGKSPIGMLFAYIISGHHSGLPDYGSEQCDKEDSVLCARLKRTFLDYSAYKKEIDTTTFKEKVINELKQFLGSTTETTEERRSDRYEFLTRYLFSCLTDADYLDTESFCNGIRTKLPQTNWNLVSFQLENVLSSFKGVTELQKKRASLQKTAFDNIKNDGPIFLLNIPTGSGKTLCSAKLAIERLIKTGKKRIIYIIPYTGVIEQTASVFEKAFPGLTILQHHSDFDYDEAYNSYAKKIKSDEDGTGSNPFKQATENWDASMIVTTPVQFFESIYGNRSGKLRKLHNMANCVFVFDEIHTLPIKLFVPCMKAIDVLTSDYESEAIFLTATMPDFPSICEKYLHEKINMCNLVPYCEDFKAFEKCKYTYLDENTDIVEHYLANKRGRSVLMIFNTKKRAREYFDSYAVSKKYYLSTYLTPKDRFQAVLKIREDLKNGEEIAVFSTSLIEAGIDLDFDCVYREISGIDNILQSGGRCNREGIRDKENSNVFIFSLGDLRGEMQVKANITKGLISKYGAENITSQKCIEEYFEQVYIFYERTIANEDVKNNGCNYYKIPFAEKAKTFKFIDNDTVSIVIPTEDIFEELERAKVTGYVNRRKLQKYCASIHSSELSKLLQTGVVKEENGIFVLQNSDYYSMETGLMTDTNNDYIY